MEPSESCPYFSFVLCRRSLVGSVLAFITRKVWVRMLGQASKRNMKKKYFFGDFLSADFWQKL